jgi:hypothetical protein
MSHEVKDGQLDAELFRLFIDGKVFERSVAAAGEGGGLRGEG